uniref:Uncharacterized protein n=1 Tax=Fagus sylvatica TaxID=28930 RepID=A0A2N9F524_FAGSY
MGHAAYSSESSRRLLSNGIKFVRIGVQTRRVMAPGSRGAGAVFARFSGEDSGQTGEATGEPRVSRCSWSLPSFQRTRARTSTCCDSRCRILTNLVSLESLCYPLLQGSKFVGNRAMERRDMVPRTEVVWSVFGPSEGIFPVRIPARPGKVLAIREFHTVHECVLFSMCLGLRINLLGRWNVPYAEGSFSDRDSGLTGGVLDDPGITRTAKNLPQFACHSLSDALALNRLTHGSKVKVGFRFLVFTQNSTFPTSAFSFPSSSDLALRKFVRLSEMSHRGSGSRDRRRSSRLGFLVNLPLLGFVADGGIPCGPFLRDFGPVCFRCHASFIEVVVALFVGSECTCIPYFRLSYLTEFLIPGLRYYHRFGRFCKRCPFAWMM